MEHVRRSHSTEYKRNWANPASVSETSVLLKLIKQISDTPAQTQVLPNVPHVMFNKYSGYEKK